MISLGKTIKTLRKAKGVTQEEVAAKLGITYQSVSKWENEVAQPDITLLPELARFFGITLDELFGYKLDALTNKEHLIRHMIDNQILNFPTHDEYWLNTENFSTTDELSNIGEVFADCIRENYLDFNVIMGMAYHGIAFSAATAVSLYDKYGVVVNHCYERKVPDSRGRKICGYTPSDGDRILIIDDVMTTGMSVCNKINLLKETANIELAGVLVLITRNEGKEIPGCQLIQQQYNANVYSLITSEDIAMYMKTNSSIL